MAHNKSTDPVPICSMQIDDWQRQLLIAGQPAVRFPDFIKIVGVGRSRAYEKWNPKSPYWDPDFPAGFPLYESPRSPKAFWVHEALRWVQARSDKHRK